MLLLPETDVAARQPAEQRAVGPRDGAQDRKTVDRIAIGRQVRTALARGRVVTREAGEIMIRELPVALVRQCQKPDQHDAEGRARGETGAGPARQVLRPPVDQQEEEREKQVERAVLEVIAAHRGQVERLRRRDTEEEERHESAAAAEMVQDRGDHERQPEIGGVLERPGPEIGPAHAPPHPAADLRVIGVRQPVAVIETPEQQMDRDRQGVHPDPGGDHARAQPVAGVQVEAGRAERGRGDHQPVGPRQRRERQQDRRHRPARATAPDLRLDLDDEPEQPAERQQLEQAGLQPAARPDRHAARRGEEQRRHQEQPSPFRRRWEAQREPDHQPPEPQRRRQAQEIRGGLRRQPQRIAPRQQHDPQEVGVALHPVETRVEDQPVALAQVARVAERDEGVVGQEPVDRDVRQQERQRRQQPRRQQQPRTAEAAEPSGVAAGLRAAGHVRPVAGAPPPTEGSLSRLAGRPDRSARAPPANTRC